MTFLYTVSGLNLTMEHSHQARSCNSHTTYTLSHAALRRRRARARCALRGSASGRCDGGECGSGERVPHGPKRARQ